MSINLDKKKDEKVVLEKLEKLGKNSENIKKAESIGINYSDFINEERIKNIGESFEKCFSFTFIVFIYTVLSLMFFITASLMIYFKNEKVAFPILFFIFSIPITLGIGAFGIKAGIKKSIDGIKGIAQHITEIFDEIYSAVNKGENKKDKKEILNFVIWAVVLPLAKIWTSSRLTGEIIYKLIEKISIKISKIMMKQEKESKDDINSYGKESQLVEKLKNTKTSLSKIVEKVLTGIYLLLTIAGLFLCGIGIVAISILGIIRIYVKY